MDIPEEVVELVAQKLTGSAGSGGTVEEALKGWLLKFVGQSKKLRMSVKSFVYWLANKNPPIGAEA